MVRCQRQGRGLLLRIERQHRQVQNDREPVTIDDKQEGQECVDGGFGDDVGVETVAEVNRVDVVTAQRKRYSGQFGIAIKQYVFGKARKS